LDINLLKIELCTKKDKSWNLENSADFFAIVLENFDAENAVD